LIPPSLNLPFLIPTSSIEKNMPLLVPFELLQPPWVAEDSFLTPLDGLGIE
jgi:hypothetical protein